MSQTNTFAANLNLILGAAPANVTDPVVYQELLTIYNALQSLAIGLDSINDIPGVYDTAVTYGQLTSLINTGGVTHVVLAIASATPKPALGFCPTQSGISSGLGGVIRPKGLITGVGSLVPGAIYYLHDTLAGGYSTLKPVGAGKIVQPIGFALDSKSLYFNPTLLYTQL